MTGTIVTNPKVQFLSAAGVPLVNGTVTVYTAGTTTPANTWQDKSLSTLNSNPIQLDSRGECVIWLSPTAVYKFVLKDAQGSTQWTVDNIAGAQQAGLSEALAASGGSALVGFIAAGGNAVARTVQSKLRDIVSVKDYGAVGDGATDDTAAIANAVAALAGGGALYFPAGQYQYTSIIISHSNVRVFGDGMGATTLLPYGWTDGIRFADGYPGPNSILNNIMLENLTIDGTHQTAGASDTYGNGANFNSCDYTMCRNVEVKNHKRQGIVQSYFPVAGSTQKSFVITECIVDGSLTSQISIGCEGAARNCRVTNNTVLNSAGAGVYLGNESGGGTHDHSIISGNTIDSGSNTGDNGIRVTDNMYNVIVSSNTVKGFNTSIRCSSSAQTTYQYLIANNICTGWVDIGIADFPMNSTDDSRTIISGNYVQSDNAAAGTSYGMILSKNTQCIGNRIESGYNGIACSGDGQFISGNWIGGTVTGALIAGSSKVVFVGNYHTPDITVGTGSHVFGNYGNTTQRWTDSYLATTHITGAIAAPVTGTAGLGDIVWNVQPSSGGYAGWICTAAGTPGTWKEFGLIT